jgi:hypothetical protein
MNDQMRSASIVPSRGIEIDCRSWLLQEFWSSVTGGGFEPLLDASPVSGPQSVFTGCDWRWNGFSDTDISSIARQNAKSLCHSLAGRLQQSKAA